MTRSAAEVTNVSKAPSTRLSATIVIPSHNRCDDLARTCRKLTELDPAPEQIVICLDGCTDGSLAMLRRDFPSFRVVQSEVKSGSIVVRDRAFREVRSDLIVSLDDDSYPLQNDFLDKVSELFDRHPEAGVLTFVELRPDNRPPDPRRSEAAKGHYVSTYAGCAAVIRRSVYGDAAHYSGLLWHNYEEPDFCVQCYARGYAVWFEPSVWIRHHFTSSERHVHKGHMLNARNELLSVFMRCPFPQLVVVAVYRLMRQLVHASTNGLAWIVREPRWWLDALRMFPVAWRERRPVPWRNYWSWMRLAGTPLYTADQIRHRFGAARPQ
jgi:GT2 family glycosyltransferase